MLSVGRSVFFLDFVNFQKERFREKYSNLSNTTKLILLESLLQEVMTRETQLATCLIRPSLYCLIHFSKSLPWGCVGMGAGDAFLRIQNLFRFYSLNLFFDLYKAYSEIFALIFGSN